MARSTTHYGRARVIGQEDRAPAHLRAVTGMTTTQAQHHVNQAMRLWQQRSDRTWALDLTMLTNAGITLARPEAPAERRVAAERGLREARSAEQVPQQRPAPSGPPPSVRPGTPAGTPGPTTWVRRIFGRS